MITVSLTINGRLHEVRLDPETGQAEVDGHSIQTDVRRDGTRAIVTVDDAIHIVDLDDATTALVDGRTVPFRLETLVGVEGAAATQAGALGPIKPPMTGRIDAIHVKKGDAVEAGDVLFVLEAMKMRNEVRAPATGTVLSVDKAVGDSVDGGDVVLSLGE